MCAKCEVSSNPAYDKTNIMMYKVLIQAAKISWVIEMFDYVTSTNIPPRWFSMIQYDLYESCTAQPAARFL